MLQEKSINVTCFCLNFNPIDYGNNYQLSLGQYAIDFCLSHPQWWRHRSPGRWGRSRSWCRSRCWRSQSCHPETLGIVGSL